MSVDLSRAVMENGHFAGPNRSNPNGGSQMGLIAELEDLRLDINSKWAALEDRIVHLDPSKRASAKNLIHYLALRRHDVRRIQNDLARNGISSLGRSEGHVMSNLDKVLRLLYRITHRQGVSQGEIEDTLTLDTASDTLRSRTCELLGARPSRRSVRVMVTLPTEAAADYGLVRDLVTSGMNIARINGAHDSREVWERMASNVARASAEAGRLPDQFRYPRSKAARRSLRRRSPGREMASQTGQPRKGDPSGQDLGDEPREACRCAGSGRGRTDSSDGFREQAETGQRDQIPRRARFQANFGRDRDRRPGRLA